MRGLSWRYPDRKRCYRCRSYFGFLVVEGLYCSWKCAGRKDPYLDPDSWPREHFSWIPKRQLREGQDPRKPKHVWRDAKRARQAAKSYCKEAYICGFCGEWHIGSLWPVESRG